MWHEWYIPVGYSPRLVGFCRGFGFSLFFQAMIFSVSGIQGLDFWKWIYIYIYYIFRERERCWGRCSFVGFKAAYRRQGLVGFVMFCVDFSRFQKITPPKFNSSPLKSYQNPIGKASTSSFPTMAWKRGELLNSKGRRLKHHHAVPNHNLGTLMEAISCLLANGRDVEKRS